MTNKIQNRYILNYFILVYSSSCFICKNFESIVGSLFSIFHFELKCKIRVRIGFRINSKQIKRNYKWVMQAIYDIRIALSVLVIIRYIYIVINSRVSILIYTLMVIIGATVICIVSSYIVQNTYCDGFEKKRQIYLNIKINISINNTICLLSRHFFSGLSQFILFKYALLMRFRQWNFSIHYVSYDRFVSIPKCIRCLRIEW